MESAMPTVRTLRYQLQNANVQNHFVIFHLSPQMRTQLGLSKINPDCVLAVTPIASSNQSVPLVGQTGVKTLSSNL